MKGTRRRTVPRLVGHVEKMFEEGIALAGRCHTCRRQFSHLGREIYFGAIPGTPGMCVQVCRACREKALQYETHSQE